MSFWQKIGQGEDRYVLLLDVGTAAVKAAVVCIDCTEKQLVILGTACGVTPSMAYLGGEIADGKALATVCSSTALAAIRLAGMMPQEICLGFSAGVVKCRSVTLEVERQNPGETVSAAELKTLMQVAYQRALAEINRTLSPSFRKAGWRFANVRASDFILDGYRVLSPLGYKTDAVKVNLTCEFLALQNMILVRELANAINPQMQTHVTYGVESVLRALTHRDLFGFSAIMIDVGGGLTDVAVVKEGRILKQDFFALGGREFSKQLAIAWQKEEAEAEFWKLNFHQTSDSTENNALDERSANIFRRTMHTAAELWLSGVEFALEEFSQKEVLPSLVLLYGGGAQLPELRESLERLYDNNRLHFAGTLEIRLLGLEDVGHLEVSDDQRSIESLTLMSLAASFFENKDKNHPNTILKEIILNQ